MYNKAAAVYQAQLSLLIIRLSSLRYLASPSPSINFIAVDNFRYTPVADIFPDTLTLLLTIVGTERRLGPRHIAIARQKEGGIPDHSDLINTQLTLHLPLVINCDAGIVVNKERHPWKENVPLILDTSFVHSTWNSGPDDALLLLVDFWHPDLSVDEIHALRCFIAANSRV